MRVYLLPLTFTLALMSSAAATADDAVKHFKGLQSETLEQAVNNFSEYNNQLEAILAGELNPQAMSDVHEITYTLENALEKIRDDLKELADTLEEVHLASERIDTEGVQKHGKAYLEQSRKLVK